jgi:peptide/nickel transport system permease protein
MGSSRRRGLAAALRTPTGLTALVSLVILAVVALAAPIWWGPRAGKMDVANILQNASARHPLGTDNLGHDILTRLLVATRPSLLLALLAVVVAAAIGIPAGALPAVVGRRAGRLVNAFIDFWVAFPALLLAIIIAVVLGAGSTAAVLAIGIASAPGFARLTQTLAASVAAADYVAAARLVGVPRRRLLFRHVLPNVAEPLILNTTISVGYALVAVSGLSFLGLGVQPPAYDWGRLLNEGLPRIYITPAAALGPAAAIVIAGLAFNGLGEALARAAGTRAVVRPGRRAHAALAAEPGAPPVAPRSETGGTTGGPGGGPGGADRPVLAVDRLTVAFPGPAGPIRPVREVSFTVATGEVLGIVGESGSGKSLTALAIAQLIGAPGEVVAERIEFQGRELRRMSPRERDRLLGTAMAMVFQDPATSLNPALRLGRQLAEVMEVHGGARRRVALRRAVDRLRRVRIAAPEHRIRQYPHQLSGGMRQRAMIAMGLMGAPELIIADEPTSALDVTVQRQILRLLRQIVGDTGAAAILITHDIAVVTELCDRVLVMYAGRIVEDLDVRALLAGPAHPYTRALVAAVPDMAAARDRPLATIPGRPPEPHEVVAGCAFAPRCAFADDRCARERPPLRAYDAGRRVACWYPRAAVPAAAEGTEPVAEPESMVAEPESMVEREGSAEATRKGARP